MQTTRTDWGRRQPPVGGSSFELQAWFFMRVSGLVLVFLAAARWETPYWRAFDWLLLTLSLLHGTNGLRVVIHDNLADKTIRKLAHSALYSTSLIFFIIGTYAIVAFVRQV